MSHTQTTLDVRRLIAFTDSTRKDSGPDELAERTCFRLYLLTGLLVFVCPKCSECAE